MLMKTPNLQLWRLNSSLYPKKPHFTSTGCSACPAPRPADPWHPWSGAAGGCAGALSARPSPLLSTSPNRMGVGKPSLVQPHRLDNIAPETQQKPWAFSKGWGGCCAPLVEWDSLMHGGVIGRASSSRSTVSHMAVKLFKEKLCR